VSQVVAVTEVGPWQGGAAGGLPRRAAATPAAQQLVFRGPRVAVAVSAWAVRKAGGRAQSQAGAQGFRRGTHSLRAPFGRDDSRGLRFAVLPMAQPWEARASRPLPPTALASPPAHRAPWAAPDDQPPPPTAVAHGWTGSAQRGGCKGGPGAAPPDGHVPDLALLRSAASLIAAPGAEGLLGEMDSRQASVVGPVRRGAFHESVAKADHSGVEARGRRRSTLPAPLRRALALVEAAAGGAVLLDGSAYRLAAQEALGEACMVLHLGEFRLAELEAARGEQAEAAAEAEARDERGGIEEREEGRARQGEDALCVAGEGGAPAPMSVYLALSFAHLARLAVAPPLRTGAGVGVAQVGAGLLQAPVNAATVAFTLVVSCGRAGGRGGLRWGGRGPAALQVPSAVREAPLCPSLGAAVRPCRWACRRCGTRSRAPRTQRWCSCAVVRCGYWRGTGATSSKTRPRA
jgi:hypothetical protein